MSYAWLIIPLAIAVLDWVALSRNWVVVHSFAKQGVIIALLAGSWFMTRWTGLLLFFGVALVFSLIGDILLLSPKLFLPGLVAFLLAQLAYILGLNLHTTLLSLITFGVLLGAAGVVALLFPRYRLALNRKPETRPLVIPALLYSIILSLMMFSAVATLFRSEWSNVWTILLVTAGGILFFISDSTLAQDRFVHPVRNGPLVVMVTYHLAQMALITGAMLNFFTLVIKP